MKALLLLLLAGVAAAAPPETRWVNAHPLLLRAAPRADAPVVGRLQQGSRVLLGAEDAASGYCELFVGDNAGARYAACQYLSPTEVAPRRAGRDGVPPETRWAAATGLLLRAAPKSDAEVLARLPLNTELLLQEAPAGSFCAVRTLLPPPQQGYTACRYLAESPLAVERLTQPWLPGAHYTQANPEFRPRQVFALRPSWDAMARYEAQQQGLCNDKGACPGQDADFPEELARMRRLLHGERVAQREQPPALPRWAELGASGATAQAALMLPGPEGSALALWKALPLPPAAASWFKSSAELALPNWPLAALAQQFDAEQRWFVAALAQTRLSEGDQGARIERLTKPLTRIELLANGSLRAAPHTPQRFNREWRPDIDYMCANWPGPGFELGDTDNATWKRNEFGERTAVVGPLRLFTLYASRPLPEGARQVQQQTLKLDRAVTGMTQLEWRLFDLDADGRPDLLWAAGTGQGPGHLDGAPSHDDPWWRVLLVNIDGDWRLLGTDQISYGCGC